MNIILIGLRGSGKSKLGKIIAQKLQWQFTDTDEQITLKEKLSIPEIVQQHGWEYFRQKEKEVTGKIAKLDQHIIATGGGTILNSQNQKKLKKMGQIVYLHVQPEICARRIAGSKNRPPLTSKQNVYQEMKQLYLERHTKYCAAADFILERTNNKNHDAETIIKTLLQQ